MIKPARVRQFHSIGDSRFEPRLSGPFRHCSVPKHHYRPAQDQPGDFLIKCRPDGGQDFGLGRPIQPHQIRLTGLQDQSGNDYHRTGGGAEHRLQQRQLRPGGTKAQAPAGQLQMAAQIDLFIHPVYRQPDDLALQRLPERRQDFHPARIPVPGVVQDGQGFPNSSPDHGRPVALLRRPRQKTALAVSALAKRTGIVLPTQLSHFFPLPAQRRIQSWQAVATASRIPMAIVTHFHTSIRHCPVRPPPAHPPHFQRP
ncbi:Uncharacterised protein [Mycobacterium tuberculosis]|nr:Uncharacterised protein [Mycobacterium tuberculosis]